MKTLRITVMAMIAAMSVLYAVEPSAVNGAVTLSVDRSKPKWKVTIHNQSKETLAYEMMGAFPRGLGIEHWLDGKGVLLHAGDLAKWVDLDGFPADMRDLKAGAKVTFEIDPEFVSATQPKALEEWKRGVKFGYYTCRVVFGMYASRKFDVEPPSKKSG